jgi:hypothetical protein
MKRSVPLPWAIVIAALTFVAGAGTAAWRGWGSGDVTTTILNATDKPLRTVTIQFETCGSTGTAASGELKPGDSRQLRFSVCGEGGYTVVAEYADGRIVRGGGGYVEAGYNCSDTISTAGIASQQARF